MTHVEIEGGQHSQLKEEVQPRFVNQTADIQSDGACIEGQDVGILHQRQTALSELIADVLWYVFAIGVL